MKGNLLLERVTTLQNEYRILLTEILPYMEDELMPVALDEIVIFWNRNMDLVRLFLTYYVANEESYAFTASTYMDIGDKENYPFMLLGNLHIMDDPLGKYCEICNKMKKRHVTKNFVEQIVLTAKDNIKIINECGGEIVVLPLRLFNQMPENSFVFQIGEKAFCSLFNGINSIKDYFEKCITFQDVMFYAREDIGEIILFDEEDNKEESLENRFKSAIPNIPYILEEQFTEGELFYQMVFGCIQQAVDVILTCIEYKIIPFIRNIVALNYFMLLIDNFQDGERGVKIRNKVCVANLLYRICNKDRLSNKGFRKFIESVKEENFEKELFSAIEDVVDSEENFNVDVLAPIIERQLDRLYDKI